MVRRDGLARSTDTIEGPSRPVDRARRGRARARPRPRGRVGRHPRGEPHQKSRVADCPGHVFHRVVVEAAPAVDVRHPAARLAVRPRREDRGRRAVGEKRVDDYAFQGVVDLEVKGAELRADHQHPGVRLALAEAVGHPKGIERRVAPHESDEGALRVGGQVEPLDEFNVEPRGEKAGAADGHHVRDLVRLRVGPVEGPTGNVFRQRNGGLLVLLVPLPGGRGRVERPVLRKEGKGLRVIFPVVLHTRVPVVDRRLLVERRQTRPQGLRQALDLLHKLGRFRLGLAEGRVARSNRLDDGVHAEPGALEKRRSPVHFRQTRNLHGSWARSGRTAPPAPCGRARRRPHV